LLEIRPCWYAAHTRSNFEHRVAAELAGRGVENYLPLFREVHRWKDRKKQVDLPIFPGYVFARFADTSECRLRILKALGVVRILGPGERIEPVPDAEIEAVRKLLGSGVAAFSHPFLREGDWVRVKRGPLKHVEGLLVRVKSQARLVLSVNVLSQSVATEIDAADVAVVRPPAVPARM
jgi:transcription antitermination factor NusG